MDLASHSANLSFIPQPVNALSAPIAALSSSSVSPDSPSAGTKTMHIFCLSFHHFSDVAAAKVMQSTLSTSDMFAIIELQDRTLGMLLLMSFEFFLLFLVTIFWFTDDWLHLAFTYFMPILPFVQAWDGLVSCLRTRTFPEVLLLAEQALGEKAKVGPVEQYADGKTTTVALCGDWRMMSVRQRHTWPFGYMNAVVGQKR